MRTDRRAIVWKVRRETGQQADKKIAASEISIKNTTGANGTDSASSKTVNSTKTANTRKSDVAKDSSKNDGINAGPDPTLVHKAPLARTTVSHIN